MKNCKYCVLQSALLFLLLSTLLACSGPQEPPKVAFYYWKTQMEPGTLLSDAYRKFSPDSTPVFLRFFDVDYSAGYGGPVPVGELSMSNVAVDRPLVPVVFIANRVFSQSNATQLDSLAAKMTRKIQARLNDLAMQQWWTLGDADREQMQNRPDSFMTAWRRQNVPEIQIDCDWTPGTRAAYFHFLETLQKQELLQGRTLSCTVRLHQYRERKENGIPPVQRGTLMCYNMDSPTDTSTRNAIFDPALLEGYLKKQSGYPLPLDIALPVFSWGAWFRSGEFRGLLSAWDERILSDTSYFQALGDNLFQLRRDTVWGRDYLREGDLVRLDNPSDEALIASAPLLRPLLTPGSRLIFFDWDTLKVKRYEKIIPPILAGF